MVLTEFIQYGAIWSIVAVAAVHQDLQAALHLAQLVDTPIEVGNMRCSNVFDAGARAARILP